MNFYSMFKTIAFQLDPEDIHHTTLSIASKVPFVADIFGTDTTNDKYSFQHNDLKWSFPVGLAAGFDKNAQAIRFFEKLGLGAVEVGTVTLRPQEGNPRPRIFRHEEISSLRNSMGFPNAGSDSIYNNIVNTNNQSCLGINIGKNKNTSEEDTAKEYATLYKKMAPLADYLVVNISSPNTPGLRSFQKKEKLTPIIEAVVEARKEISKPVFIKISPDLDLEGVKMVCELSKEYKLAGVIATNTTSQHEMGAGGLSGKYIRSIALDIRKNVCEVLREDKSQTIIGAGGIDCYQDLKDFWAMGGHFVQVYTSLIYKGPEVIKEIKSGIDNDFNKLGCSNISHLIENISR